MSTNSSVEFDPFAGYVEDKVEAAAQLPREEEKKIEAPAFDESKLSPEERAMINGWVEKIDLTNSGMIMAYGTGAQNKIAKFSDSALENIKTKDLGEMGDLLSSVVVQLKGFEEEEDDKGFMSFFKKKSNKITALKAKYDAAEVNVDKIVDALNRHQIQLLKDVGMLDQMYEENKNYFKELSMYIIAGKKKIAKVKEEELPALIAKASESGLPEDAQAANDLAALLNRFEKKVHDLELTRMVSIQMAPQIRLVQNNDTIMAEKIQSTIVNTIPLWKSQMVLALGVAHSNQAAKAQTEVTNLTNELLRQNAATLKMATIETAKVSERGVVDMDTLVNTNKSLIETLDEVMQIQEEGRNKRAEAEVELRKMEEELRKKLLETKKLR